MTKERTTAMPTLLLITLVLCLAASVLHAQGSAPEVDPSDVEVANDMETLETELHQGCGSAHHVMEMLHLLEEKLAHREKYSFTGDMIETYIFSFMTEDFGGLNLSSNVDTKPGGRDKKFKHSMNFPADLMEGVQAQGVEQRLVYIYIHSPCIFQDAHNSSVLNDDVQGAFLQSGEVVGLSHPVEIQFWHDMVLDDTNATCVFWQPGASKQQLRDNTTRIHMHLLAALLLLNATFLLSTPLAASTKELCQVAAALLHASLLCALAWMAAEAFHLNLLLIKVYNIYVRQYLLKLCLFAWGLPTLAVVAIFIFRRETYGYYIIHTSEGYQDMTMCWLTSWPAHYATLLYAGVILLFNTVVLGRVVAILRRTQQLKWQARKDWVTVLGLTCLLGTTWGLVFFHFGTLLIAQLYIFTILNSLQGLFVCLWYVTVYYRNKMGSIIGMQSR
ncbi:Adgrg5 [Columba guinea]|nr:Adgrg5 [Columba guinea]